MDRSAQTPKKNNSRLNGKGFIGLKATTYPKIGYMPLSNTKPKKTLVGKKTEDKVRVFKKKIVIKLK